MIEYNKDRICSVLTKHNVEFKRTVETSSKFIDCKLPNGDAFQINAKKFIAILTTGIKDLNCNTCEGLCDSLDKFLKNKLIDIRMDLKYNAVSKERLAVQFNELKRHLREGMSLSKSAKSVGIDYEYAKWLLTKSKERKL